MKQPKKQKPNSPECGCGLTREERVKLVILSVKMLTELTALRANNAGLRAEVQMLREALERAHRQWPR